jgi:hypothetical protein
MLCSGALASGADVAPGASGRNCAPPKYPGSGYFTSLKVTGVSCATGGDVTLAHYRCRTTHGAAGRCTSKVRGYTCHEKRTTIPSEIDAIVVCRNGDRRVRYSYQQNT